MSLIRPSLSSRDQPPLSHGTRAGTIYGFMGAFVPLAFVAVVLRLYARRKFAKIGLDDVAITIGFILYIGLTIATVYAVNYGLGLHIWDVNMDTVVSMQKCGFSSQVLYPPALAAIKLSILFFLLRALPPGHMWKVPLYCFATFVAVEESAFTVGLFLQCRPINFYWDKTIEGVCFNQPAFYYADAALNMTTDICILSLPWLIFKDLNMPKRRKYELLTVCSVGVFTLIASAVRLPYLHDLNLSQDPTWSVVDICIWSFAELGSAITLSSVPAIRPLLAEIFPKLLPTSSNSGSSGSKKPRSAPPTAGSGAGSSIVYPPKDASSDPEWLSYTEMDEMEDGARQKTSTRAESRERILGTGVGIPVKTADVYTQKEQRR